MSILLSTYLGLCFGFIGASLGFAVYLALRGLWRLITQPSANELYRRYSLAAERYRLSSGGALEGMHKLYGLSGEDMAYK